MEELRKMILQRGGEVRPKLWNKGYVKYIIAPSLTLRKFDEFKNYKVVKEGWIVESCKEGRMLDWTRWKLQIAGGWEENGRKGLEGFLRGEPSQRPHKAVVDEPEVEEVEEQIEDGRVRSSTRTTSTQAARGSLISQTQVRHPTERTSMRPPSGPTTTLGARGSLINFTPTRTSKESGRATLPLPAGAIATPVARGDLVAQSPKRSPTQHYDAESTVKPATRASLITQLQSQAPTSAAPNLKDPAVRWAEMLPVKDDKPEGPWENYYTKSSNEHAADALKNSEWRIKNTAERGNEGGFIDGYYQNSR
jgi:DNA repair protein REV1